MATIGDSSTGASASVDFPPSPQASICGFKIGLPRFALGFIRPAIAFPPPLPKFYLAFELTCDPSAPVDVTAGLKLPFGGGRTPNADPSPDLDEAGF